MEQELNEKESELNKREDLLFKKVDRVEEMLQNVAKTLAVNTNYATMVAAPVKKGRTIKFSSSRSADGVFCICLRRIRQD